MFKLSNTSLSAALLAGVSTSIFLMGCNNLETAQQRNLEKDAEIAQACSLKLSDEVSLDQAVLYTTQWKSAVMQLRGMRDISATLSEYPEACNVFRAQLEHLDKETVAGKEHIVQEIANILDIEPALISIQESVPSIVTATPSHDVSM